MNRRKIKKNRIAFKIWTADPRVEKYKIGAVVAQILETIRFILFRDDLFTRGQSNMRRFINERSATNIRDWSLAYSFIWWHSLSEYKGCYTLYLNSNDMSLSKKASFSVYRVCRDILYLDLSIYRHHHRNNKDVRIVCCPNINYRVFIKYYVFFSIF